MKKFSVVSIASEVAPFSKTGGLADVTRSLPKSLKRLGHDSIVITPLYKKNIDKKKYGLKKMIADAALPIGTRTDVTVSYYRGELMRGLPIYFVSCDKYFGRKLQLYGSKHENRRFYIFDVAALHLLTLLGTKPDIIHCHDWHAGLVPELLKRDPHFKQHEAFANTATVFTIHNLAFQLGHNWWEIPGPKRDRGITPLPDLYDDRHIERINFTKRAILYADIINAVSETYADEILKVNFGQDLHRILQNRKEKLFGVVNGIDYLEFNPTRDKNLAAQFSESSIERKKTNREALQKKYQLERDDAAFVAIMTSRIAEQKGFDILLPVVPALMSQNIQLLIMGDGEKEYIKEVNRLIRQYPKRIALVPFSENERAETMLYAGADVSLFPSRFEPCGTGQLKSFRYGCVPIAHRIGGLSDTVSDYDRHNDTGNGFVFETYDSYDFLAAIIRAHTHYRHEKIWKELMIRGMRQSNSWELPARKYIELYKKALAFKKNAHVG